MDSRTFLAKKDSGDDEILYMYFFQFYSPKIAADTLKEHKLGLGIYVMRGFKTRNKESKKLLKRLSNMRGSFLINKLKILWGIFKWEKNAI